MPSTSRNTETSQYLPHTIYHKNAAQKARRNPGDLHIHILQPKSSNIHANAAQQARRNEKSRRPTQQSRGLGTSQNITSTTFSIHDYMHLQLILVSTSIDPFITDNLNTPENSEVSKRPNGVVSKHWVHPQNTYQRRSLKHYNSVSSKRPNDVVSKH